MSFKILKPFRTITKKPVSLKRKCLSAVICFGFFLLVCACSSPNYGKLQSSHDITKIFENEQLLSDHLYYYSGLQGVPNAIVGIHPNYFLKSKVWRQVDLTSPLLKKWVYRMRYVHLVTPQGAWILGPDGNRIGIWYSAQHQTTVRLEADNRVVIVPPEPPELRGVP